MLEELIKNLIEGLKEGKLSERMDTYIDYKNPYTVLKPSVKVEVELSKGVVAKFDISDFFKEALK